MTAIFLFIVFVIIVANVIKAFADKPTKSHRRYNNSDHFHSSGYLGSHDSGYLDSHSHHHFDSDSGGDSSSDSGGGDSGSGSGGCGGGD